VDPSCLARHVRAQDGSPSSTGRIGGDWCAALAAVILSRRNALNAGGISFFRKRMVRHAPLGVRLKATPSSMSSSGLGCGPSYAVFPLITTLQPLSLSSTSTESKRLHPARKRNRAPRRPYTIGDAQVHHEGAVECSSRVAKTNPRRENTAPRNHSPDVLRRSLARWIMTREHGYLHDPQLAASQLNLRGNLNQPHSRGEFPRAAMGGSKPRRRGSVKGRGGEVAREAGRFGSVSIPWSSRVDADVPAASLPDGSLTTRHRGSPHPPPTALRAAADASRGAAGSIHRL
jgi:hypothetical protein